MKKYTYVCIAVFLLGWSLLLNSCRGQKVATVTEYKERVRHDTLQRVDSVYISHVIRERGDTIYMLDTVLRYAWRDRVRVEYVRDSIPYVQEVQIPVRMRNGYDRFTSWGFWILVLLLLVRLAWWVVKKYYLRL